MNGLKESGQAVGADMISSMADFAPPTILSQAARLQAASGSSTSGDNVPGPQFPLFLLGRRLPRSIRGAAGRELRARAWRSCPTTAGSTSG